MAGAWVSTYAQAAAAGHNAAPAPVRAPDPKLLLRQIKAQGAKAVLDTLRAEQWPLMLKDIEGGDATWLDVAVAFDGTADADLAGSLTLAVGVALAKAPRKVLSILGGGMPVDAVCGFPDLGDPRTDTQEKVIQYLDARARAIRKLGGKVDPQVREDCLAVLDRRRQNVLSPDGPFSRPGGEPVIDNDRVTVWDTTAALPPAEHDFIAVPLGTPGSAVFGHRGEVPGQSGRRTIVIELKDHAPTATRNTSGYPNAFPRPGAVKLLEDARVLVWRYRWQPGEPTPMHYHDKDALVVYEEDAGLQSTTLDGSSTVNHFHAGDARYNPRGRTHSELLIGGGESAVITELK